MAHNMFIVNHSIRKYLLRIDWIVGSAESLAALPQLRLINRKFIWKSYLKKTAYSTGLIVLFNLQYPTLPCYGILSYLSLAGARPVDLSFSSESSAHTLLQYSLYILQPRRMRHILD